MTQYIMIIISIFALVTVFLFKALSRYKNLKENGKIAKGKVLSKPIPLSNKRRMFSPPDINNGIFLLHYEFSDSEGNKAGNASYVSRKNFKLFDIGSEIDVSYKDGNILDNKPTCTLSRDINACYGLIALMLLVVSTLIII